MTWIDDLEQTVDSYLSGKYDIVELEYIPTVDNVGLGKKAYKVKMLAMFIDMRNSSSLMSGWKETSVKVHKAFLKIISETVIHFGGKIRDFQGDGILASGGIGLQDGPAQTPRRIAETIVRCLGYIEISGKNGATETQHTTDSNRQRARFSSYDG